MSTTGRLRLAEITSGIGALVTGIGLGATFGVRLAGLGAILLTVGVAAHAWGMFEKHRLERNAAAPDAWWAQTLYWLCWIILGLLSLAAAGRFLGPF